MDIVELDTQPEFIIMPFQIGVNGIGGMYKFIEEYAEEKNYVGPIAVYHRAAMTDRQTKLKWHVDQSTLVKPNGASKPMLKTPPTPPRKNSRWTDEELLTLVEMKEKGYSEETIGEALGRTPGSCSNRWSRWMAGETKGAPS
jgi:hypothetical protein